MTVRAADPTRAPGTTHATRRTVLQAAAAAGLASAARSAKAAPKAKPKPAAGADKRPNFLFILCDQLGLDAIAAHGCKDVRTPNIDRLVRRGTSFLESHSTNPVCSPARSTLMTGRMPRETGVISNTRPIHPSCPNMGQWFRKHGYQTVYCGKWHLPGGYQQAIPGFDVLPVGQGQGDLSDAFVSRSSEAFLKGRERGKPFVFVASLMQPHDICYWAIRGSQLVPPELPFPHIADQLPALPPNHRVRPKAPRGLDRVRYDGFTDAQWRYYIWIYYRQVEMVDGDIGRILDALEESGQADNTVVILTADHGEGRGRHQHVQKWYPYEEAVKVPLVWSCPKRIQQGVQDRDHLVSGVDVMSTMCDLAGIPLPPHSPGTSLRPVLEGKPVAFRPFVVAGTHLAPDRQTPYGQVIRTQRYKYVRYKDDPVDQLFDMQADPWETRNLAGQAKVADEIRAHRKLLDDWHARLKVVPPTRDFSRPGPKPKGGKR